MPPAARAPRWSRLSHEDRRDQIMAVARRMFRDRPYASVSMSDIAEETGVARGLLHHYFGSKRDLYLEVLRELMRVPDPPGPEELADGTPEERIASTVDLWLDLLSRNRKTWLAVHGAQGFGRDREVEAILDGARESGVDLAIELVGLGPASEAPPELRALLRSYAGLAEEAAIEWLVRRRLEREQLRVLLVRSFMDLLDRVLPEVQGATMKAP